MEVKSIPELDLSKVIQVHKSSFKGFFLTELGDGFLHVYYDCVRKDKKGVLLGFYEGQKLMGFCAATTVSNGFNSYLIKENISRFFWITLRLVFTNLAALIRLSKNLTKKNPGINDKGDYAELLSIGVADDSQGKGIGKALLTQLENELQKKGSKKLSLTTDFNNNEKAISFYEKLGYEILYNFIAYPNRKMFRMIKKLN